MTHNEIQERLDAYHDRQLSEADRIEVEVHFKACRSCRESIDRLAAVSRAVFRPVAPPNTDFFVARVMARVREVDREASAGLFQTFWQWMALALTAIAAVLIFSGPSDNRVASRRVLSTRNILMADSSEIISSSTDRAAEPMDSLLDLSEEI